MHFCVELEECCKNLFKPSKGNQSVEKLFWDVFDLVYHDSKHNKYKSNQRSFLINLVLNNVNDYWWTVLQDKLLIGFVKAQE